MMYKYEFTSTVKDLLEAEEAERSARSVRTPFRWILTLLGIGWLLTGIAALDPSNLSWRPFVWILLGMSVLYYFILRPYQIRSQIKQHNAAEQELTLEFNDDSVQLDINGVGSFTRKWEELIDFVDAQKGIIFYFSDGVVNWLPDRVFVDKSERKKFIEFVRIHQEGSE